MSDYILSEEKQRLINEAREKRDYSIESNIVVSHNENRVTAWIKYLEQLKKIDEMK